MDFFLIVWKSLGNTVQILGIFLNVGYKHIVIEFPMFENNVRF